MRSSGYCLPVDLARIARCRAILEGGEQTLLPAGRDLALVRHWPAQQLRGRCWHAHGQRPVLGEIQRAWPYVEGGDFEQHQVRGAEAWRLKGE